MKIRKFTAPVILAAIMMTLFVFPANTAQARELNASTAANPYFTAVYQNGKKPVKFKKHSKTLLQGDFYILNLQNVGEDMQVTFRSSDSSVLSVKKISDSSCRVTGMGYGSAKIIARITTDSGFFFFDEVKTIHTKCKVFPKAASVRFRTKQKKISLYSSVKLAMTIRPSISKEKPVFQVQNSRIATVSSKGIVTGRKPGRTYVTATIQNGKTAKCKIIVKKNKNINGKLKKVNGKTKK